MLDLFPQAMDVDDVTLGNHTRERGAEVAMSSKRAAHGADEMHVDADPAKLLGHAQVILRSIRGDHSDPTARLAQGHSEAAQGGDGSARLGIDAGDDVYDAHLLMIT